jgi:hypothetical protein
MDRALIYSLLVVAGVSLPLAHAYGASQSSASRVQRTAYSGQSGWSNAGPSTAPTISAQGSDRYATQPTGNWQGNTTQSVSERAQNAVSSTANSLRDGFNAGTQGVTQQTQNWSDAASRQLQSAGTSVRNTAEQAFGAPNLSPPSTAFASPPPPASYPTSRGNLAPPPAWPTSSPASTSASSSPFDSQASRPSNDRSLLTNSSTPASGGWTSIGTNVAAPPLLIPPLPGSTVNPNSFGNTTSINGPALGTDSYLAQQSNRTFINDPPSPTTTTARSAPADDWTTSWNTPGPETARPASGRGASAPSTNNTARDTDLVPLQRASTAQDTARYRNDERATDSWVNDRVAQRQESPTISSAPANSQPTSSKSSPFSFGNNNTASPAQPSLGQPSLGQSSLGQPSLGQASPQSLPANTNYAVIPPHVAQQMPGQNPVNPYQTPAATNTSQPWMPFIAAVLSLAFSLAGNLFLGWSYMDARQKYQSLVRRTADTFRRTKTVAA